MPTESLNIQHAIVFADFYSAYLLTIVGWIIMGFLGLRIVVALTNLITRQWMKNTAAKPEGLVSVLIPARNEENAIGQLLHDLMSQDHPELEIIVYDDDSEDQTRSIVEQAASNHGKIRLIQGLKLPPGWLGKNHACHQLTRHAKGDYFLFLDADVRLNKGAIRNALQYIQQHKLDLLSLFPSQRMISWGEKISVPLMNWVLVSLLPLILTRISSFSSLSAANGQFMLFRASCYKTYHPHERFRKQTAEDIVIARFLKSRGHRIQTLLGGDQVFCRMYGSLQEASRGFSKNVLAFFGNSSVIGLIFATITSLGIVPIYLGLPWAWTLIYIAGTLLLRALVSLSSNQSLLFNLINAPIQQFIFFGVVLQAVINRKRKTNTWKGRFIDL